MSLKNLFNRPRIAVKYNAGNNQQIQTSCFLWQSIIFKSYDLEYLNKFLLPDNKISFRSNPEQSVDGNILKSLIDKLLLEIKEGKTVFKDFTVLRNRTFNKKLKAGSLTLKFKDYPFVLKLFITDPYSFTHPLKMGFEAYILHMVGGGVNRHIAGLTRIKNLGNIKGKLSKSTEWSHVEVPRKWFYKPENYQNLQIEGFNFEKNLKDFVEIPSVYCVISDFIQSNAKISFDSIVDFLKMDKHDKEILKKQAPQTIALCNYLNFAIDLNIDNFVTEKDSNKLVIIDSEHYPTLAGWTKQPPKTKSYALFSLLLFLNALRNIFWGNKLDMPVE